MKKNIIIYAMLLLYMLLTGFVFPVGKIPLYNEIVNPAIWIGICTLTLYLSKDTSKRVKDKTNKTQSVIIAMIIYIIVYYLLGLVFGFQKTPYAKTILNILQNIWSFASIVVFQEIVRAEMIRLDKKNIFNYTFIIIVFALLSISFTTIPDNYTSIKDGFIFTVTTLIPAFVTSAVLTYLAYIGGAKLPIIYRMFIILPEFIIPIIPSFEWFVTAVMGLLVPVGVFIYLNYVHLKKVERLTKRTSKRYNPVVYIPALVFIVVLTGFVIGLFKYQPVAILSGSMSPTFNRGDAVVIRKLTTGEKGQLKKKDIIHYTSGSKYVAHRIVDMTNDENGNKLFITKGDHNNANDVDPVSYDQVIGKVTFSIPYIGYPAVWLSGLIS